MGFMRTITYFVDLITFLLTIKTAAAVSKAAAAAFDVWH